MSVADAGWRSRRSKPLTGRVGSSCAAGTLCLQIVVVRHSLRVAETRMCDLCVHVCHRSLTVPSHAPRFVSFSQKLFHWANCELRRGLGCLFPFGDVSSQAKFVGWQIWKFQCVLLYIVLNQRVQGCLLCPRHRRTSKPALGAMVTWPSSRPGVPSR